MSCLINHNFLGWDVSYVFCKVIMIFGKNGVSCIVAINIC